MPPPRISAGFVRFLVIEATPTPIPRIRRTGRDERALVALLAVLGGVGAAMGPAAPTEIPVVDAVYVAAAGATLALAGSRSRRTSWLFSSLLVIWLAPTAQLRLVSAAAVGIAVWSLTTRRHRWAGALIGAVLAVVSTRLGSGPFHGATSIAALAAATPMLFSAGRRLPGSRLRALSGAVSALLAAAALATMAVVAAAILAVGDVTAAIDHAAAGFRNAADGDQEAAADRMDDSRRAFEQAQAKIGGIWAAPARLVPVVGQHVRAVQVAASEGVSLTATAAETTRAVDIDDVRIEQAAVDLALLDTLAPVLDRAEDALVRAEARLSDAASPWLLPPVAERLEQLTTELDDALPTARTATLAVRALPEMLGRGGPVHWLVLVTTPAEARGLGGLVGNFLVVEADEGRVEIVAAGRNEDLNRLLVEADVTLGGPGQYRDRWARYTPEVLFQDVTLSPDLPSVAAVAADLYEQATGLPIDGVVTCDPFVVEAVLDLTGPVQSGDLRLTSDDVVDFLLRDQYARFADDDIARVLTLGGLIAGSFDAFTAGGLPGPRGLAAAVGPLVEQDRLGYWWRGGGDPADLADATGFTTAFPRADGGDLLGLLHQNAGQNKIDVYLERTLDYDLVIDDGRAVADVVATFTNTAPPSGLPDAVIGSNDQGLAPGTNLALVHLHTALDLVSVSVDGVHRAVGREAAFDHEVITTQIEIAAGATVVVAYTLTGRLAGGDYRLALAHQPLVNDDRVRAVVTIDGVRHVLVDDEPLTADRVLTPDAATTDE